MIRNEDVGIMESTDQKWTCPGQRGKSRDNRKPQRGHPGGPQEASARAAGQMCGPGQRAPGPRLWEHQGRQQEGRGEAVGSPEKLHASRFPGGWAHLSPALWEPILNLTGTSQISAKLQGPHRTPGEWNLGCAPPAFWSFPALLSLKVWFTAHSSPINAHLQGANAGGSGWSNLTALLLHATPAPALPISEIGVPKPWWPRAHLE